MVNSLTTPFDNTCEISFSLNDALITVNGIAHRVGSIIVATELPATKRPYTGRYDYCLYYNSGIQKNA